MEASKPIAEFLVEGELSPFEHEASYKLLKKHFRLERRSRCADIHLLVTNCNCRRRPIFHRRLSGPFFCSDTLTTRRIGGSRRQNMEAKQGLALAQGRLF